MADVFISYARADRAFVERLAAALEAEGLSVWWDRRIEAGSDFVEEIERELEAAGAVVVVWSKASRKSRFVRAEALHALNTGVLKPVSLDGTGPSPFFATVQYQDLTGWTGDRGAAPFQALLARLRGAEAAAQKPAAEARPAADLLSEPARRGGLGAAATLIAALTIVGGVAAYFAGIDLVRLIGPYWAGAIVLATAAVALFRTAENAAPARAREVAASWIAGQRAFTSAEAFLTLFEAVFTRRHWSFACFFRSVIATLLAYGLLLALFVDPVAFGQQIQNFGGLGFDLWGEPWQLRERLETNALVLLVLISAINIFADYLSLWQTRTILRWSTSWLPLWLGVLADALLTAAIFIVTLPLSAMLAILIGGDFTGKAWGQAVAFAPEVWRGFWMIFEGHPWGELQSMLAREASLSTTTLLIACATTFITSLWLWLALLATPLFRLLAMGRRGISRLGRALEAQGRPIAALGYGAAALIVLGAGAAQAAQLVLTLLPNASGGRVIKDCAVCPEMVSIPGGSFWMGSPEDEADRDADEGPQRRVTIAPFAMGVTEITFREWDACVAATAGVEGGCRPIPRGGDFLDGGDQGWGRGLRPVVTVSWEDAQAYVAWLNSLAAVKARGARYRLPSEAEWEYAARAGTATRYWMGDDISTQQANGAHGDWRKPTWSGSLRGQTLPVGAFEPNPFGVYDVHGNVWEWTQDCWHGSYQGAPADGSAWMDAGGGDCSVAVLRGGSWDSYPRWLRSAIREIDRRGGRNGNIGFRVARTHRGR